MQAQAYWCDQLKPLDHDIIDKKTIALINIFLDLALLINLNIIHI